MSIVELKRPLKLGDLETGKIFDEIELVVSADRNSMTTVVWQSGMSCGEDFEMRFNFYDIESDANGNVLCVDYNGNREVLNSNPDAQKYSEKLKAAGIQSEE